MLIDLNNCQISIGRLTRSGNDESLMNLRIEDRTSGLIVLESRIPLATMMSALTASSEQIAVRMNTDPNIGKTKEVMQLTVAGLTSDTWRFRWEHAEGALADAGIDNDGWQVGPISGFDSDRPNMHRFAGTSGGDPGYQVSYERWV